LNVLARIDELNLNGWYTGPWSPLDQELGQVLRDALGKGDFEEVYGVAFPKYQFVLSALAERLIGWAVRCADVALIELGLVALYLAGGDGRSRDSEIPLCLARRAAELVRTPFDDVATAASGSCPIAHRAMFVQFALQQTPEPGEMGFVEVEGETEYPYFRRAKLTSDDQAWWAMAVLPPSESDETRPLETDAQRLERLRKAR